MQGREPVLPGVTNEGLILRVYGNPPVRPQRLSVLQERGVASRLSGSTLHNTRPGVVLVNLIRRLATLQANIKTF